SFASCMIALGSTGQDLKNNGNTTVTLNNCSFISDSTSPNDSVTFNGGVTMTAGAISTAGGAKITGSSNYIAPPVTTNAAAVSDPYAGQIAVPTVASLVNYGCPTAGGTLQAGYYTCGKNNAAMLFQSGTTRLCPGVYLLDGAENSKGEALGIHGSGTTVIMGTAANGCLSNGIDGV